MVECTCFKFIVSSTNRISEYRSLKELIEILLPTEGWLDGGRMYRILNQSSSTGKCMFKVDNRNTSTRCEICSKLTIKIPE